MPDPIRYRPGDGVAVQITRGALRAIREHAAAGGYVESGGGLYAAWRLAYLDGLTVTLAERPGRTVKRRRDSFTFDRDEMDQAHPGGSWVSGVHPTLGHDVGPGPVRTARRMIADGFGHADIRRYLRRHGYGTLDWNTLTNPARRPKHEPVPRRPRMLRRGRP